MGLLDLLTGNKSMMDAAFGMLKTQMKKGGLTLVALEQKDNGNTGEGFEMHHFTEPVTIIKNTELEVYKSAVTKCIEHGIEF